MNGSMDELQRELDAIFANSFDGLWIFDGNGVSLRVNPAYERLSGFRAAELIGKPVEQLLSEGLLGRSVVPEVIQTRSRATIINHNRNGKRLLVTGTPVFDESGSIWRIVCNIRDISELDELYQDLERKTQLVSHYAAELTRYREKETTLEKQIIGRSAAMSRVIEVTTRVAMTDSTVLILGESGVGKEVLAELIHHRSMRGKHALIKVNCSAIPETLMEAEFFGYERGAFTGALPGGKAGLFEMADKGTIFLDEIGDLPLSLQAKLLRILQDYEVQRIGSTRPRRVNVRVLAATNQGLDELVQQGRFRADLFYRLNVIPIQIPALRERPEDIPPLIGHFLTLFEQRMGRERVLTPEAAEACLAYSWPGNIRELRNVMERLVVLTTEREVALRELPREIREFGGTPDPGVVVSRPNATLREGLEAYEGAQIRKALKEHRSIRAAARELGISHQALLRRLKQLNIAVG
ncbi:MAG: Fis family transcriptional regulator [Firmicutes bacterium]|nr:Fis family transcriptional regulator [Bacillota bacterium]